VQYISRKLQISLRRFAFFLVRQILQEERKTMKSKSNVKAGSLSYNHSQTAGLKTKTKLQAGGLTNNHCQASGLMTKSKLKAGALTHNHNQTAAK